MKNKKILITGGNGYLGSFLTKALLKEGADVAVIDTKKGDFNNEYILDITNKTEVTNAINKIQPKIIFHLAASLSRDRNFDGFNTINKINHQGTYNLLSALKDIPYENFIFSSTSEVYGNNVAPFHEEQIPDPVSPYSLTKVYSENLIRTFSHLNHKNFTILRLFNFYGKNMSKEFFIPQMINALKTKKSFEMTEGAQTRDFLYIDDVVNGMLLSAQKTTFKNQTYNLCSSHAVSLKELVLLIKETINSNCNIHFGALPYRKNEIWNMMGDNSKIRKKLGFKTTYSLKSGISQLIN